MCMQSATEQLCQGASAGEALAQAVGQGGEQAVSWVYAIFSSNCPGRLEALSALGSALRSMHPSSALLHAQELVTACQELGIGKCLCMPAGKLWPARAKSLRMCIHGQCRCSPA